MLLSDLMNGGMDGALIDNFILSASTGLLQKTKLRMEREIDHSITYGIVMRKNSTETEKCFRKYIRHYPQRVFEIVAENLTPVKVPLFIFIRIQSGYELVVTLSTKCQIFTFFID